MVGTGNLCVQQTAKSVVATVAVPVANTTQERTAKMAKHKEEQDNEWFWEFFGYPEDNAEEVVYVEAPEDDSGW